MEFLRWIYHRIGQMACFGGAGLFILVRTSGDSTTDSSDVIVVCALLVCGVALRAIDVWQRMDDPSRE